MKSTMFNGSRTGLLALLLCLITAIDFCSCAPYHGNQLIVRERHQLDARKVTEMVAEFKDKQGRSTTVGTSDDDWIDFSGPGPHILSSDGFEGCVGVILASNKGAILGHYTQTPGDLTKAQTNIKQRYTDNLSKIAGATPHVYAQVDANTEEYKVPDIVNGHIDYLTTLTGRTPVVHKYIEMVDILYDQDFEEIEGLDYENIVAGAMLVENPGGGSSPSNLLFIDIETMKLQVQPE